MDSSSLVREIQDRQTQATRRLAQIQQQIYTLEDEYLDLTTARGNVSRGWEGYLDSKSRGSSSQVRRDRKSKAGERLFSFSSVSAPIPKSDLEKDEDALTTIHWAKEYTNHVVAALAELSNESDGKSGNKVNGSDTTANVPKIPATSSASALTTKRVRKD